jgi:hypothetical protein
MRDGEEARLSVMGAKGGMAVDGEEDAGRRGAEERAESAVCGRVRHQGGEQGESEARLGVVVRGRGIRAPTLDRGWLKDRWPCWAKFRAKNKMQVQPEMLFGLLFQARPGQDVWAGPFSPGCPCPGVGQILG